MKPANRMWFGLYSMACAVAGGLAIGFALAGQPAGAGIFGGISIFFALYAIAQAVDWLSKYLGSDDDD